MEVEYELTPEDVVAFNRYRHKHQSGPRIRFDPITGLVVWILCCLFGLGLMCAIMSGIGLFMIPLLVAVSFGFLIGSIGVSYYAKWMFSRTVLRALQNKRDAEKVLAWERVLLDEEGVHVASEFSSCHFRWNGIEKVATTEEYVFIYVTTAAAQIVPLRAFADGRAFDAFADEAKRYHAAARVSKEERPRPTGIQTPEQTSKNGTVGRIITKNDGPRQA